MKVLNERILVKVADEEEKTESGIILTATKHERKYEGVVVDVGTNPDIKEIGIKPGDYVYYPKGLNTEMTIDGVIHDIVSVYDILAVGKEDD